MTQICPLIDIIIPAYKAQETIIKLLQSIAEQSISDKIKVTIVNDYDEIGYDEIVKDFSKYLDIQTFSLQKNKGPGVARQSGIDNTNCKYIVFADADDTFYGSFALEMMFRNLERNVDCAAILGEHYLEIHNPDLKFIHYMPNYVWTFGKMYRRSFLDKYDVRFNETRANEDVGFNRYLKLVAITEEEKPIILNHIVYCWHENKNSITRATKDFLFSDNITGYIENMTYALQKASKRLQGKNKHYILKDTIATMADIYLFHQESYSHKPEYSESNLKAAAEFYKLLFEEIELVYDSSFINNSILEELRMKKDTLTSFLPNITYHQFMNRVREIANEI